MEWTQKQLSRAENELKITETKTEGTKTTFTIYSEDTHKINTVEVDKITHKYWCSCWWYSSRVIADPKKYGICSHILKAKIAMGDVNIQKEKTQIAVELVEKYRKELMKLSNENNRLYVTTGKIDVKLIARTDKLAVTIRRIKSNYPDAFPKLQMI